MNEQEALALLNQLRNGELPEVHITKEHFLPFRAVLVEQEDREQFVGQAQKGGSVRYSYIKSSEQ